MLHMMCFFTKVFIFSSNLCLMNEHYSELPVVLILPLILCLQMGDRLILGLMPGKCTYVFVCLGFDSQDETRLLHSDLVLIDEEVRIVSCLPVHRSVYFYYGS